MRLCNICCRIIQIPYIVSLFMKSKRRDPNCYRRLSVRCTLSRVFEKVMYDKIRQSIGHKLWEDQSGFTPDGSCIDNLFTLLMKKYVARRKEVQLSFADLEKLYDTVPAINLWEALKALGIDGHLMSMIVEYIKTTQHKLKNDPNFHNPLKSQKGLR